MDFIHTIKLLNKLKFVRCVSHLVSVSFLEATDEFKQFFSKGVLLQQEDFMLLYYCHLLKYVDYKMQHLQ